MLTLRLDWTASAANQMVTSYNVYQSYNTAISYLGNTVNNYYEINSPASGSYMFRVSAINIAGESATSGWVVGPAVPTAPSTPVISFSGSV